MDEGQNQVARGDAHQQKHAASSFVYEYGTWRQIPAAQVRHSSTQGRPPKKKGG